MTDLERVKQFCVEGKDICNNNDTIDNAMNIAFDHVIKYINSIEKEKNEYSTTKTDE